MWVTILANKIQCARCLETIESKSVHDFRWCKCGAIFVDGGKEYFRRGGRLEDIIELSDYFDNESGIRYRDGQPQESN